MRIDENRIFEIIKARRPSSVALNGPVGLIAKIQDTAENISKKFGIPSYIIGDTCWGSCDLNTHAADMLGVDLLFNIGHSVSRESFGERVIMIDAYDDISFDKIARKCALFLLEERYKILSLLTDSQHLNQLHNVKNIFEEYGYKVIIGKGKGQLRDGQVFGCEFYPAFGLREVVDAHIFLGQSRFHTISIAMSTEKPTYMLDPYFEEFFEINKEAEIVKKRAILSVYNALDARRIGIVIGLKDGQFAKIEALNLKKLFENLGRSVQLIAMTNLTNDDIRNFKGIDAFVEVACPRIPLDDHFDRPMLSVPQAFALIRLMKNEPVEDLFRIHHWL